MTQIRPLNPAAPAELDWVALGMRATLIEVEGEAQGTALYTLEWLRERARWHLDHPVRTVLLACDPAGQILGHTILRREEDAAGVLGLVSTTYVVPAARRHGVAQALLSAGEAWFTALGLGRSATWTSATNTPLIALYQRQGYAQVAEHRHETTGTLMIQLQRELTP